MRRIIQFPLVYLIQFILHLFMNVTKLAIDLTWNWANTIITYPSAKQTGRQSEVWLKTNISFLLYFFLYPWDIFSHIKNPRRYWLYLSIKFSSTPNKLWLFFFFFLLLLLCSLPTFIAIYFVHSLTLCDVIVISLSRAWFSLTKI